MKLVKKINNKLTGKIRYQIRNRINHIKYKYSYTNGVIKLEVKSIRLKNPKLECTHGQIAAKVEKQGNTYTFTFTLDDIPNIDGIITHLFFKNGHSNKKLFLSSFVDNSKINYAKTYDIMYTDDFVYYFRNTASRAGRLVLQKKVRAYFENEDYEKRVEAIYQQTLDKPVDKVLLYEKFGEKFEESSSKIFEKIYDYPNVYFVLDRNSDQYSEIKAKYGEKIVSPDEDKFIELLFTAKYYIGTEVPFHMVTLRTPYPRYRTEILKTDLHKFIFLQHGVMYALSLKPASRNSFKKNGIHSPYKVVVSSELEAEHLMSLGKYKREDLWKTGLATFDNKKIKEDADKISVMLTWRPWDEQKDSFEETTYYHAVKSIVDTIENKEKLQLIFHPKVLETIDESNELLRYKYDGLIDDALNETKVLISDYSSVTFDAFYRGANVVFWWNQKEECLEQYKNVLMLNESNIFGDTIYTNDKLNEVIDSNYHNSQQQKYIDKYKKIVEFDDNCNTNRIIAFLNEEGINK